MSNESQPDLLLICETRYSDQLKPLVTSKCPFINLPEPNRSGHGLTVDKMKECVWVMPERRCELEFVERTHSGRLRHALFRRLLS